MQEESLGEESVQEEFLESLGEKFMDDVQRKVYG